jgi:hypothetical protein
MASPVHNRVAMVTVDDQWSCDMQRMVVVVFDSEAQAHKASRALEKLADDNFIAVNADSVVTKDPDGTTRVVQTHDVAPEGTMGGAAVGGLIGMIGGPAGLAIGARPALSSERRPTSRGLASAATSSLTSRTSSSPADPRWSPRSTKSRRSSSTRAWTRSAAWCSAVPCRT